MEQAKKTALTKQKILSAAETQFSEYGFAAARIDEIARAACVNKQLIYAHFESKENLYIKVLESVYSRLADNEKLLYETEFKGIGTVKNIITEYFDFLIKNPSFVRLVLWENLSGARYVQKIGTNLFSGAKKLLYEGKKSGIIRKDIDIEEMALSINMFCFSAFSNVYTMSKLLDRDISSEAELKKRASHITDVIIKYIVKGDGNAKP